MTWSCWWGWFFMKPVFKSMMPGKWRICADCWVTLDSFHFTNTCMLSYFLPWPSGAKAASNPAEVASQCEKVITMLPSTPHVQEVSHNNNIPLSDMLMALLCFVCADYAACGLMMAYGNGPHWGPGAGANDLTHLPLDKMAAILQTTFSSAFSWKKSLVFCFEFLMNFVPKGPIDNNPELV